MRIGPFISLISSTFGVPETTVVVIARALREAGWLTSGARGVNAPDMTTRDAARLSLALLTGEPPGRVVEEFAFIRGLQAKDTYPVIGLISQKDLPDGHVLEDLLIALFGLHLEFSRINEYSHKSAGGLTGPFFRFSVDASRRTAAIDLPNFATEYVDISGETELDELYSIRPMTLEAWERIQELESRSMFSDVGLNVVSGRGMRVVRTITQDEIRTVAEGLFGIAPE